MIALLDRIDDNIVGIDLAAKPANRTGFAVSRKQTVTTMLLKSDEEIISQTVKANPCVIAIDAPLSLPRGDEISRQADRLLVNKGFRCLWPLLPTMEPFTERGIHLKKVFENYGFQVIEVFPSATQKILGIPTKKAGKWRLRKGLTDLGITITIENPTHHELDAITAALTGLFYLAGRYEAFGDEKEGQIIMPICKP